MHSSTQTLTFLRVAARESGLPLSRRTLRSCVFSSSALRHLTTSHPANRSVRRPQQTTNGLHRMCNTQRVSYCTRAASYSEIAEALKVLGVDITVEGKELKKQYHQLVKKHHPDMGGSEAKMKEVTRAYNVVSGLSSSERSAFKNYKSHYGSQPGSQPGGFQSRRKPTNYSYNNNAYNANAKWQQQQEDARRQYNFYQQYHQARGPSRGFGQHNDHAGFGSPTYAGTDLQGALHRVRVGFIRHAWKIILFYCFFSLISLLVVRRLRNFSHADEWRAADTISRAAQLEEMSSMRQRMEDRMRESHQRSLEAQRIREQRQREFFEQREVQRREREHTARAGPSGTYTRREEDPIGVLHYEPKDATA